MSENKTTITLTIGDVMGIANWMESYRDPNKQPQLITIEKTETGIGPVIKAYIETSPGQGVYKDFTDYKSW
jgi:hypothetical protein